ncbi:uncharacterized protein METZ01_LOCUS403640 [marine metagenome]|uniref:Uncharacterized protein n=1 Tax=marine metagenome TaxID=408172 RepID=A0A382VW16_9ZZZZ
MAKRAKSSMFGGERKSATQAGRKRTSIGRSKQSRPKNKTAVRCWKRYRGQGK